MKHGQIVLFTLVPCFLAACSDRTQITVINNSASTLTNIVASGSGFSQSLRPLAPGAQHRFRLTPHLDSNLKLAFDADGKHFVTEGGYFENGYKVSANVAADFSVTVR